MKKNDTIAGYIPTLDGWRACAIALVFATHYSLIPRLPVQHIFDTGRLGVSIFFAISGVLICGRLLDEEAKHGSINLRRFFIRRCFRILPPALLYLLVVAVLAPRLGDVSRLGWLSALFFFRNYVLVHPWHDWYTGHFWSLSVEEHFYLFLPFVLVFFPKMRVRILLGTVGAVILCRFIWVHFLRFGPGEHTDTVVDALLVPALLAMASRSRRYGHRLRQLVSHKISTILLASAYLILMVTDMRQSIAIRNLLMPLLLLSTCWNPKRLSSRVLESAPLRWVGRISYSIYLWQQLFISGWNPLSLGRAQQYPFNVILALLCACASYYLLERPMIRLGHRLTGPSAATAYEVRGTATGTAIKAAHPSA